MVHGLVIDLKDKLVSRDIYNNFKTAVARANGTDRGHLSQAIEEAMMMYIEKHAPKSFQVIGVDKH